MYALKVKPVLSTDSDFTVAITTVHRSVTSGFKGYFRILAALGTFYGEHLSLWPIAKATVSITLCFSCLATGETALGLIGEAFASKELLFFDTEGKSSPAIGTLD